MRFTLIESTGQLDRVLSFLAGGFGWTDSRLAALRTALGSTGGFEVYGAAMEDATGTPVMAMLFFHQGSVSVDGTVRPVINLSSWYCDPAHRGLESVLFANRTLAYLHSRDCIVTDYTPNDAARSILLALGMKSQTCLRIRIPLWQRLIGRLPSRPDSAEDPVDYVSGFTCTGTTNIRDFTLAGRRVSVAYSVRKTRKWRLPLNIVRVVWTDDYRTLTDNLERISVALLRAERAVAADVFVRTPTADPSSEWLISDNAPGVSFLPPLQSELSCI